MATYEFRLPVEGEPDAVERFRGELLEQLLDRRRVVWQRVAAERDGSIYVALAVDGPMEQAAAELTDAFNAAARIAPGVRHADT